MLKCLAGSNGGGDEEPVEYLSDNEPGPEQEKVKPKKAPKRAKTKASVSRAKAIVQKEPPKKRKSKAKPKAKPKPKSKKKTTGGSKVMSRRRKRESLEGNRRFVRAHVLKITVVVHFSSPPVFSPFQQMAVKVQRWGNTQPQYT